MLFYTINLNASLPPTTVIGLLLKFGNEFMAFATLDGKNILILNVTGSKWIEADILGSTTLEVTLRTLYPYFM